MTTFERNRPLSEINVTPLVDVMLVLLIVFMVTAPLLTLGLDVQLPEAVAANLKRSEEDVIMTIDKKGHFYFQTNKTVIPLENLEKKIKAIFDRRNKKELLIQADKDIRYGTVVRAISLAKKAGVEKVGMITKEEEKKKKQ